MGKLTIALRRHRCFRPRDHYYGQRLCFPLYRNHVPLRLAPSLANNFRVLNRTREPAFLRKEVFSLSSKGATF